MVAYLSSCTRANGRRESRMCPNRHNGFSVNRALEGGPDSRIRTAAGPLGERVETTDRACCPLKRWMLGQPGWRAGLQSCLARAPTGSTVRPPCAQEPK